MLKSRKLPLALFFGIIVLTIGCKKQHDTADNAPVFKNEASLVADSTEIGVIIKVGSIFRVHPYIVVSDIEHADGAHFAVFNDSLKYLYSFCDYGSGSDECLMPSVIKNMPENRFLVRDNSNDFYHSYILSDSGAIADTTFHIKEFGPYECVWEANYIDTDKYLIKGVKPKRTLRRLVTFTSQSVIDSLAPTFNLAETMGKDYYTEFDDFWMVANEDSFACAYYFINRIEFGYIKGDKIEISKYVGAATPPEFFPYTNEELSGKYKYNVDYNPVYYEWLFGSAKNVYASYFGEPWGDIDKHSHIVEVYSYGGEPLVRYNLDVSVASFIVLDDKRIIGVNPNRSDDMFYCFDL